ncbi:MAG TPA: serine hydrolase [Accumulibacter sp.]|uniref:serine hydrolase domain-containing protein n=1 Tax=Accumulibacter sp. TaxID=2053492 RepID=UPI002B861F07|nr:serine hydrolase [Accumulibacter sp.]HRD88320.1 serine hydrolase [Accumulibacter sp.]
MNRAVYLPAITAAACLQGCTLLAVIVHNFPGLDDGRVFAARTVARPAAASPLRSLAGHSRVFDEFTFRDENGVSTRLAQYLEHTRTAAFAVLHNNRIVYERYGRGYDERSLLNSFSIAKAVLATLVGIALADGSITSLDDTVEKYRPEFAGTAYGTVTVRRLVTMTSGMADEPALLASKARYYYGDDLHVLVARTMANGSADKQWRYSDADAQMLGFVLESAVGMSVSAYLEKTLWKPLGMESDAIWSLDRDGGVEKAFCCLHARARDFARFGRLYLQHGRSNGTQLVPADWAALSVLPAVATSFGHLHQQFWWRPPSDEGDFFAYGHDGQYLYVSPRAQVVIVKFSETRHQNPVPMFRAVANALTTPQLVAGVDRQVSRLDH